MKLDEPGLVKRKLDGDQHIKHGKTDVSSTVENYRSIKFDTVRGRAFIDI